MASHKKVANISHEPSSCCPGSRRGTPISYGSVDDPHFDLRKTLCDMSHMLHGACNSLSQYQCVPSSHAKAYEQAYYQEHQKLKEAVKLNGSLGKSIEQLKSDADYHRMDAAAMHSRLQETNEQHGEALRNAADRIICQDKKIDELLLQITEMVHAKSQSPAASEASSLGKRRNSDVTKCGVDTEEEKDRGGRSRKRRQAAVPNEDETEHPA